MYEVECEELQRISRDLKIFQQISVDFEGIR